MCTEGSGGRFFVDHQFGLLTLQMVIERFKRQEHVLSIENYHQFPLEAIQVDFLKRSIRSSDPEHELT